MKKFITVLIFIGSISTFAANQSYGTDYSEYSRSTPLDRTVYHDRSDINEVRKNNPLSSCSDYKKQLVADAFNVDSVSCNVYESGSLGAKVKIIEEDGLWEVLKIVNNQVFYVLL